MHSSKTPTAGTYRITAAGAREYIVEPTFICVWRGPSNERGANQYAIERSANRGTALAWCDSLQDGEYLCRQLNGGEALQVKR